MNWVLLGLGYLAGLGAGAEWLRRKRLASPETTRNLWHLGVGLTVIPTVVVFSDWRLALVAPLALVAVHFVAYRFRLFPALGDDPLNPGAVFFPLSLAALLALCFRPGSPDDLSHLAVAGVLCMALGDPAAAWFGRRTGTRRFTIFGASRTMEGSLAMFVVSAAAIGGTLWGMGVLAAHPAAAFGLVVGTAAAGLEAMSPYGTDNLTVPLGSAGILHLLLGIAEAAVGIG